jgi:hypothetical protein
MNQEQKKQVLEVIWNKEKEQFEVYSFMPELGVQFLMLVLTIEDVKQQITEMMIHTVKGIAPALEACGEPFDTGDDMPNCELLEGHKGSHTLK